MVGIVTRFLGDPMNHQLMYVNDVQYCTKNVFIYITEGKMFVNLGGSN